MSLPPVSSGHHDIWKCKHGTIVQQCRCMVEKQVKIVECPIWCKQRGEP